MSTCLPTHRFSTTRPHVLSHHSKSKQIVLLPYPFIINLFTVVVRSLSLFSSSALLHYSHYYLVTITPSGSSSHASAMHHAAIVVAWYGERSSVQIPPPPRPLLAGCALVRARATWYD